MTQDLNLNQSQAEERAEAIKEQPKAVKDTLKWMNERLNSTIKPVDWVIWELKQMIMIIWKFDANHASSLVQGLLEKRAANDNDYWEGEKDLAA